jgi:DNA-binding transcriptional LysR family regulator
MVRGGLGVTILPETAREVRAEPGLVVKAIDHPAFVRPIAIVKKRGRALPAVTERFVERMRATMNAPR